jgi:hypothetical protein
MKPGPIQLSYDLYPSLRHALRKLLRVLAGRRITWRARIAFPLTGPFPPASHETG